MNTPSAITLRIEPGGREDLAALAPLHYCAGDRPGVERVLVARWPALGEQPAGVLAAARPALNGAWRRIAWPGLFEGVDRREAARRLNERVRTIARVIVDPRARGLGVGVALVRAYLADPLTPCTEAVASMGSVSPFFERAGMRAVRCPVSPALGRLLARLELLRVEPFRLACPEVALGRAGRRRDEVEAALRAWARASRATYRLADGPIDALCIRAAWASTPRWAFVAGPEECSVSPPDPRPEHLIEPSPAQRPTRGRHAPSAAR